MLILWKLIYLCEQIAQSSTQRAQEVSCYQVCLYAGTQCVSGPFGYNDMHPGLIVILQCCFLLLSKLFKIVANSNVVIYMFYLW